MKYILLLLIFLFKINPCSADNYIPYLNLTNKAEYLYDQGKYLEAKWTFEEAFKLVEKIKYKDLMVYSMILSQQNEQKKIYKLLKNHVEEIGGGTFLFQMKLKGLTLS